MKGQAKTFFVLALIMFAVAAVRWYMKGWAPSLGLSETVASMLTSLTILALIGMIVIFAREGRFANGRYWRAGGWWLALAAWETILIVVGILLAARTGASTYYSEMVMAHRELPPAQPLSSTE
jgi:hypothetical protein